MGLVGYSDSEGSDSEDVPNVAPAVTKPATRKPPSQKVADPSAPRKIKVDLPTIKPEVNEEEERPAKKPRTGGLGGFNSFLPAPKRTNEARKPGLGAGVSLRTGAEPAFSRERPEPSLPATNDYKDENKGATPTQSTAATPAEEEKPKEVKMVGNAMRFKPLSVANKKKKKPISAGATAPTPAAAQSKPQTPVQPVPAAPPPKKKVSLFSVAQEEVEPAPEERIGEYQPMLADSITEQSAEETASTTYQPAPTHSNPNSLDTIASDLNLSASQRRQLFGRNKDAPSAANIMHFDMETEYASNEVLRQQGQAQEHRAVKAIAPGKHSLQQLVNAASTQKEALEDKWAEGKRNKAEGGSRYGW